MLRTASGNSARVTSFSLLVMLTPLLTVSSAACQSPQLVSAAIDYPTGGGGELISIREFDNQSPVQAEQTVFYNPSHPDAQKAKRQNAAQSSSARFTYALAHNVAVRVRDVEGELKRAGLPVPIVVAYTEADPGGRHGNGRSFRGRVSQRPEQPSGARRRRPGDNSL